MAADSGYKQRTVSAPPRLKSCFSMRDEYLKRGHTYNIMPLIQATSSSERSWAFLRSFNNAQKLSCEGSSNTTCNVAQFSPSEHTSLSERTTLHLMASLANLVKNALAREKNLSAYLYKINSPYFVEISRTQLFKWRQAGGQVV